MRPIFMRHGKTKNHSNFTLDEQRSLTDSGKESLIDIFLI